MEEEDNIEDILNKSKHILYYQPQITRNKLEFIISGYEALSRLYHPELGIITPNTFIPYLEKNKKIIKFNNNSLKIVCQDLNTSNSNIKKVSVNTSIVNFLDSNYFNQVIEIINKYRVNPNLITLEITETGNMSDPNIILMNIRKLKNQGISISIDDLEINHPCFEFIDEINPDEIKLSKDLTKNILINLESIPFLYDNLFRRISDNIDIVVEGIETMDALFKIMRVSKVSHFQGYLISKPHRKDEINNDRRRLGNFNYNFKNRMDGIYNKC